MQTYSILLSRFFKVHGHLEMETRFSFVTHLISENWSKKDSCIDLLIILTYKREREIYVRNKKLLVFFNLTNNLSRIYKYEGFTYLY